MEHGTNWTLARIGETALTFAAAAIGAAILMGSSCNLANKAPTVPVISGPSSGVVGVPVTFKAAATDPENDSIAFQFDWGDTTTPVWSALVASGETLSLAHTYADSGTFLVKAKARDAKGKESGWSDGQMLGVILTGAGHPDSVVARIPTHTGAYRMAISADGRYLYVTHQGFDLLSIVDVENRAVLNTVTVGRDAYDATLTLDGAYALVTALDDSSLSIVRTADKQVVAKTAVGYAPHQVVADPSGTRAYVTVSQSGWLAVVTLPGGEFTDTVHVSGAPVAAVVDSAGGRLYVTEQAGNRILAFGLPALNQVAEIPLGSRPSALAMGPNGMLYALTGDSSVVAIRTSDGVLTGYASLPSQPQSLAVAPDGNHLYVTTSWNLRCISAPTMSVLDSVVIDQHPTAQGVVVGPGDSLLFVANYDEVVVLGRRR